MKIFNLSFDGSISKNPGGVAAYGFILSDFNGKITEGHEVIGSGPRMSCNVSEYHGLIAGLEAFIKYYNLHYSTLSYSGVTLQVRGDSQLVIKQMNKEYKAKSDKLYYISYLRARSLSKAIRDLGVELYFSWIPREKNTECDELSKRNRLKKSPKLLEPQQLSFPFVSSIIS